jgi:hypothetical protein
MGHIRFLSAHESAGSSSAYGLVANTHDFIGTRLCNAAAKLAFNGGGRDYNGFYYSDRYGGRDCKGGGSPPTQSD